MTHISRPARLIILVALVFLALAVWRFWPPSGNTNLPVNGQDESAAGEAFEITNPASTPRLVPPTPVRPARIADSPQASNSAAPRVLSPETLVGTKWEREGFAFEFAADGRLLIGGRERAQWRVEGSRIRLYRDTTGEEHWLDIVGDKLFWEGQELGRKP